MLKSCIALTIIIFISCNAHSQTRNDTIVIKNNRYVLSGKSLRAYQIMNVMKDDPLAYREMRRAVSNKTMGSVIGFAGGSCIGYPIGQLVAGVKPEWGFAGLGAGLLLFSIPFSLTYKQYSALAVSLYNSKISQSGTIKTRIDIGMTVNGIGVYCHF